MTDPQPDMQQPNTFWAEVRRRGVFRVGGIYVAGGFVLLQLGEIVLPAFNAPDWALQTLVVFVTLGFPVAVALSWVYDLGDEGLTRTRSLLPASRGRLLPVLALIGVTAVSAGLGAWWFSRSAMVPPDASRPPEAAQPADAAFASRDPAAPITAIAVLPLAHFAEGDDLFARQLHDEIITRLSELTSLRVVSRTSVERYRTTDQLLPEIAAELRVQAIVTGSVAMTAESDSVRISIQLLHAPSDTHMESLTWQREMKDILRLQTEIAVDIATLVQGELGAEVVPAPEQIAQVDPEAHRAFLHGREELERGSPEGPETALTWFDRAVANDTTFARAWAWRAGARVAALALGDSIPPDVIEKVREDLEMAAELGGAEDEVRTVMVVLEDRLDQEHGGAFEGLRATIQEAFGGGMRALEAGDSLRRRYAREETGLGRRLGQPSPMTAVRRHWEAGQYDSAAAGLRTMVDENPRLVPAWMALEDLHLRQEDYAGAAQVREERILATMGETADALAAVEELRGRFDPLDPVTYWEWRDWNNQARQQRGERVSSVELALTAVGLGDIEGALEQLEIAVDRRDPALLSLRRDPVWDPLRADSRFREIERQAQGVWQGRGRSRSATGRTPPG